MVYIGEDVSTLFNYQKEIQQRVKQLEEKDDNASILTDDEVVDENLLLNFELEFTEVTRRTYAADTFYWEENTSGTRNQFVEAGTGPVFREAGFTEEPVDAVNLITEGGDELLTEAGDNLIQD